VRSEQAQLQWFYNAAGQVKVEQKLTAVWRHEYDELGNRITTQGPDGHRVSLLTYGSGHVHGMRLDEEEIIGFERDDLHREITRNLKNGLMQAQGHDPLGRLKELTLYHSPSPGQGRAGEGAGFGLSHMTTTSGQLVKRGYTYDPSGQLTQIRRARVSGITATIR
jgi:YD repeat-containing protein